MRISLRHTLRSTDPIPEPSSPQIDRAAALAEGAPGVPAKFVYWVLGVALVVSLGGLLGEHLFSSAGLNPVPTTVPEPAAAAEPAATPRAPAPDRSIDASLESFMGLSTPTPKPAPAFTLTDQNGQATSVPSRPPRVVVLTFFNAPCNDICPVLADEIEQADTDLGAAAQNVEFLTVNTDPSALAQSAEGPVLSQTGLGALPNWRMLTGPLATLNPVWKAYGVSISVDEEDRPRGAQRRHGLHRPAGRPALPGHTVCRREHGGDLQPARLERRAMGSGHRHLHDATARSMSETTAPAKVPLWQRHRGLLIVAVVLVILLITVLSDLPVNTSRADDISAERSVMSEVNTDLAPCALAIHQAIGIWNLQAAHQLTPADRAPTPGLLSDDQTACSFTSENIYDLTTNIQVPGTAAGKDLGQVVATATLWTTSDALRAIEDVQTLMVDPGNAAALHSLAKEEGQLAADRATALAQEEAADHTLDTHLQPVDLPAVSGPTTG